MADKRISQLVARTDIANNDVVPIVASGASTTNKATISSIQTYMQENLDVGVTSVGLAMPSAFLVSGSPVTTSGNISVTGAGTVSQYIRGDGSLADFPQGGGGGGASVNYYLNGSVSQGTIGGIAYREMNRTPILGTGTDFVAIADGYLASFITDAGDPALLEIPAGNWNFETYFSASSGGGSPSFYVELYKVNSGGTATLIASNSGTPELIAFGTTITPYFSALAVPTTTLTLTDRLALRYYVARSGRTITLHTENGHLCQIITTFTTGLTALNGLTAQVQNFTTGTSGTDFGISSTGSTHTFNLPDASATARGVVTTGIQTIAGIKNFTSTIRSAVSVEMAATGTALPTELKNINGPGLSSSGSNGIGFNSSNNLYFAGSEKGCAVISMTNTGTRTYTLQDTSGVIALTSNIPTNPLGGSGTINQIPKYTSSTTTLGNSNISDNGTDVGIASRTAISLGGQSIIFTPNLGGTTNRIETTGSLPLALVTGGALTLAAGGATPHITLGIDGNVGIGVTPTAWTSGWLGGNTDALEIGQVGSSLAAGAGGLQIANNAVVTGGSYKYSRNFAATYYIQNTAAGEHQWFTAPSGTAGNAITFTQRMNLSNTGALGIGVTSPNTQFHVAGSATINDVLYLQRASSSLFLPVMNYWSGSGQPLNGTKGDIVAIGNAGGDGVVIANANTERVRINSTGVGIGTSSPEELLDIRGANRDETSAQYNQVIYSTSTHGINRGGSIGLGGATNGTGSITAFGAIKGGKENDTAGNTAGALIFLTRVNGGPITEKMRLSSTGALDTLGRITITADAGNEQFNIRRAANTNQQLIFGYHSDGYGRIQAIEQNVAFRPLVLNQSGGNVGIGVSNPQSKLEVVDGTGCVFRAIGNGTNVMEIGNYKAGGEGYQKLDIAGSILAFYTGTAGGGSAPERMRITSGGELYWKVNDISGTALSDGGITFRDSGSNKFIQVSSGLSTDGLLLAFYKKNGSVVTNTGTIETSGNSTNYNTTSDYRIKEDFREINGFEKLSKIKVYDFKWKDSDARMDGVIAHELQEILPYAVTGQKDAVDEDGNDKIQGVDYSKIVPVLIKAIQEQQEQIDSLKNQIK
jgi:hypothetical protein